MANNANVNKVIYGGQTLVDLTQDTVEPDALLAGYTAHDASGAPIEGSIQIDDEPTSGSDNLVRSGGVADAIAQSMAETGIATITMSQLSFTQKGSMYVASISLPDETHNIPTGVKIAQVCKYGGGIGTIPFVQTDNDGSNLNVLAIDNPGSNLNHYIKVRWYK